MSRNKRTRMDESNFMQVETSQGAISQGAISQGAGQVPMLGAVPMYSVFEQMRDADKRRHQFSDNDNFGRGVSGETLQVLEVRIENIMGRLSQQQSVNYMLLEKMTELMDKIERLEKKVKMCEEVDVPSYIS